MEKVFVALLAGDNTNNTTITDMWGRLPFYSSDPEVPFEFIPHIESGVRGQELGRNRIVKAFLESDCDILWQIDDDMRMFPDTPLFLMTPDWDVLAPVQFMFQVNTNEDTGEVDPSVQPCVFQKPDDGRHYAYLGHGGHVPFEHVEAVGGGCFAVRRHVIEDRRMHLEIGCDPPAMFRTVVERNYVRVRGNDIDFCKRAKENGYKVAINWKIMTGHVKQIDLMSVEIYAKKQWQIGYETGVKNGTGIQVDQVQSGPNDRPAGNAEPGQGNHAEVDQGGMDRAVGAVEAQGQGRRDPDR